MPEYIERQKLFDALPTVNEDKQISLYGAVADFMVIASSIPTADVVKVKHGYWKGKPIAGLCTVGCSVCGMAFSENSGRWLYCPNCGAKMDLKEGAENVTE